ncbi:MAG: hypothetical protein HY811_08725 [Planctomycetes bacterium]|nr:hypothetical protein [Planctomycetota bacterium]
MQSIKKLLPVIVAFIMGVFFALQYYIPHPFTDSLLTGMSNWGIVISGFAMGLGIVSLFHLHISKIKRQVPGWGFSILVFVSLFTMLGAGIYCASAEVVTETGKLTIYGWLYQNLMVPLQSTMFSVLAFYIASAAFRAFRAKTREATLLLIAAIIVMFARVPMGEYLYKQIPTFELWGITFPPAIGQVSEWLLKVLNTAAQGGISLGICLGSIAMSLKIIFGIERAYMGGAK